jgi:Cft2 family RNA processing exonuclease
MDEGTEIIVLTSLVQTAVITLTLLVFIFQFRSQETAIKESSYQNLMGRYNDFMMVQAEKPELSKLLRDWLGRDAETKIAAEDISVVANLLIAYGIVEEAFLLYAKKWINEETWEQWAAWLKDLTKHPRFDLIHQRMRGQFDKRFQDYVSKVLEEK